MRTDNETTQPVNKTSAEARASGNVMHLRAGQRPAALYAPDGPRRAQRTDSPEYPLERTCTHRYEPFQLTFARHARQLFRERDDVELRASHQGLTIRAETEDAMDAILEVLEDFYGSQVRIGPLMIRYHKGATLEQPWMGLRIRCAPKHFEAIKNGLMVRNATIVASQIQPAGGVIQACAPLAQLIGYSSNLRKLTSGSAEQVMWLSHYAPVECLPPDGGAAA